MFKENTKYNNLSFSLYFILFLILIIFPSFFSLLFDGTSKRIGLYPGIILSSVFFLTLNNFKNKCIILLLKMTIIFCIIFHFIFNYYINQKGLNFVSINSLIFLICITLVSLNFANICNIVSNKSIEKTLSYSFFILNLDLILSLITGKIVFNKSFFLFSEPSHFALIYIPILFFNTFRYSIFKFICFFIIFLTTVLYIQSLVLFLGSVLIMFFYFFRNKYYILILFTFSFTLIFFLTNQYFYDRLNIVGTENLSLLVFMCGWERAYLSLLNTNGLGIGLNQLGYTNNLGYFRVLLAGLDAPFLNIYDGGSTAPKIISELGILGIFLILLYLITLANKFKQVLSSYFISPRVLLCCSFYLGSFFELFIRGSGYFNVNIIMLFTALFMSKK